MEKIIEVDSKAINVRGLKRREVKQLKRDGVNFSNLDNEAIDDVMDTVFALQDLDREAIDELCYGDASRIFRTIMELTFMTGEEQKN
jgi:hypothetical protein